MAFKRAGMDRGPDPVHEQILLWHKARRSLVKSRVHLLNEADHLIVELPLELRECCRAPRRAPAAARGCEARHRADGLIRSRRCGFGCSPS